MTLVDGLRRIGAAPALEPAVALLLRAHTTRDPVRFALAELGMSRRVQSYRLRHGGPTVLVRHGTGDVVTLGEVFHRPDYEPPLAARDVIGARPRILDLGANVGYFGAYALGLWPQARIEAFEPDPTNAAVLRRVIAMNALEGQWSVRETAASSKTGTIPFIPGRIALSHEAHAGEPEAVEVAAIDVVPLLASFDLVKMDIEGGEWKILMDPRFADAPPRALVFEYHPAFCPHPDPRRVALDRVDTLGYLHHEVHAGQDGHGTLWAWRP